MSDSWEIMCATAAVVAANYGCTHAVTYTPCSTATILERWFLCAYTHTYACKCREMKSTKAASSSIVLDTHTNTCEWHYFWRVFLYFFLAALHGFFLSFYWHVFYAVFACQWIAAFSFFLNFSLVFLNYFNFTQTFRLKCEFGRLKDSRT